MYLQLKRKMSSFPMRNLLLNSLLLLLLLSSCSPRILKDFRKTESLLVERADFYPFFPSADTTHLFNMQIDFRKNHFSGLLLIKSLQPDVYRIVFNTHFGMSVFDFEFDKSDFRVHYCMEALNKKNVITLLENDFRTLLFLNLETDRNFPKIYSNEKNPTLEIYKNDKFYYLKDNENETLISIEAPHFFSSLSYGFTDYIDRFPSIIRIKHSRVGIKMQLEKVYLINVSSI